MLAVQVRAISTFTHFIMVIAAWATPNAICGDTHKQIKYLVRVHKAILCDLFYALIQGL